MFDKVTNVFMTSLLLCRHVDHCPHITSFQISNTKQLKKTLFYYQNLQKLNSIRGLFTGTQPPRHTVGEEMVAYAVEGAWVRCSMYLCDVLEHA